MRDAKRSSCAYRHPAREVEVLKRHGVGEVESEVGYGGRSGPFFSQSARQRSLAREIVNYPGAARPRETSPIAPQ
jgi:hypothetical protein